MKLMRFNGWWGTNDVEVNEAIDVSSMATASLAVTSQGQPRMLSLPLSRLGWHPLIHMAQFEVFLWIFEKPLLW